MITFVLPSNHSNDSSMSGQPCRRKSGWQPDSYGTSHPGHRRMDLAVPSFLSSPWNYWTYFHRGEIQISLSDRGVLDCSCHVSQTWTRVRGSHRSNDCRINGLFRAWLSPAGPEGLRGSGSPSPEPRMHGRRVDVSTGGDRLSFRISRRTEYRLLGCDHFTDFGSFSLRCL